MPTADQSAFGGADGKPNTVGEKSRLRVVLVERDEDLLYVTWFFVKPHPVGPLLEAVEGEGERWSP